MSITTIEDEDHSTLQIESMMNSIVNAQRFKLSDEYESDTTDAIIFYTMTQNHYSE